ncbi:MAG: hypothetical protein N3B10_00840 [Armatimonadetes bacterium]|nr:hypothetical protein [Armatimonadota bacterium]
MNSLLCQPRFHRVDGNVESDGHCPISKGSGLVVETLQKAPIVAELSKKKGFCRHLPIPDAFPAKQRRRSHIVHLARNFAALVFGGDK